MYAVDNSSKDDSLEKLVFHRDQYEKVFRDFVVSNCPNRGFGTGHNFNLKRSSSPYFLVSNVDLEFESTSLLRIVEQAVCDEAHTASWEFRQQPFEHPKDYNPATLETSWSSSACILFKRTVLESVGGYDEKIFLYGEDVELSYRLRDKGFVLRYCPRAVCYHHTYESPAQVKRNQFIGSTLANAFIRLRYGSIRNVFGIVLLYLKLLLAPAAIRHQRFYLSINILRIFLNAPYFLLTRKQSQTLFQFYGWDYSIVRDGAFYQKPEQTLLAEQAPLVSVMIRTYGERISFLKEAIASVLNQTYSNIEICVVEDGSDHSKGYVESLEQSQRRSFQFKYRALPKVGRCHAGNAALEISTGSYLIFLDDDDLFFSDHIETLLLEMLTQSDIAAAYSSAFEVRTDIKSLSPLRYEEKTREITLRQPFSKALLWHHNYIPIQSILFKRALYEENGGLDASLDALEDWNLWIRYSLSNDFYFVDKTTSLYRTPYNLSQRLSRQQIMDGFYQKAVEKHQALKVETTPAQFLEWHLELNSYERWIAYLGRPTSRIKRVINRYMLNR